uniref:Uncharacterized protein n=1 Tax=Arundo donax TaxID=35708 RepID=A0A0A9H9V9_ARUDO
MGCETAREQGK